MRKAWLWMALNLAAYVMVNLAVSVSTTTYDPNVGFADQWTPRLFSLIGASLFFGAALISWHMGRQQGRQEGADRAAQAPIEKASDTTN